MNYENSENTDDNGDLFNADIETPIEHPSNPSEVNPSQNESGVPCEQTAYGATELDTAADVTGGSDAIDNDTALQGFGHNRKAYVRDLILDPRFHERRAFDPDDIERLKPLVSDTENHRPVLVVEKDCKLYKVDSTAFCAARLAADPNAMVSIEIVRESEVLAIRQKDYAKRAKRELMGKVRLAAMLTNAGVSGKKVGRFLGVGASRISQLYAVAKTEAQFEALAGLTINQWMTTPRFWSSIHDTLVARGKLDNAQPKKDGPSRVEQFEADIAAIVAEGKTISLDDIRKRLGLNEKRKDSKPVRMRGTRVIRDGLMVKLVADERRRTISIDPSYSAEGFADLVDKVAAFLIEQEKDAGSAT